MSLVALFSGVLNSMGRFAAAAAAPIVLNVVLITVLSVAALLALGNTPQTGVLLTWGVSVAGALQFVMLVVACYRAGIIFPAGWPRMTPGVKRLIALGIPGVIAGGITQINILIGTIIASLQEGAVSYLYYADRVYQLPLGVVGIAIGIVLLPDLSRKLGAGDNDGRRRKPEPGARVLHAPDRARRRRPRGHALSVVQVLFERGAFNADDTWATAAAVAAFGVGLPSFVLIKVFSPGFFAREDTRTPMIFAGISMITNVAGSLLLFSQIGHIGIALASSAAGWINAILLIVTLRRRGQYSSDARLKQRLPRIMLASAVMGAVLWVVMSYAGSLFDAGYGLEIRIATLAALVAFGIAVFFAVAEAIGAAACAIFGTNAPRTCQINGRPWHHASDAQYSARRSRHLVK